MASHEREKFVAEIPGSGAALAGIDRAGRAPSAKNQQERDQACVPGTPDLLTTTTREWLRARNPSLLRQPKGLNETGNQH